MFGLGVPELLMLTFAFAVLVFLAYCFWPDLRESRLFIMAWSCWSPPGPERGVTSLPGVFRLAVSEDVGQRREKFRLKREADGLGAPRGANYVGG